MAGYVSSMRTFLDYWHVLWNDDRPRPFVHMVIWRVKHIASVITSPANVSGFPLAALPKGIRWVR